MGDTGLKMMEQFGEDNEFILTWMLKPWFKVSFYFEEAKYTSFVPFKLLFFFFSGSSSVLEYLHVDFVAVVADVCAVVNVVATFAVENTSQNIQRM